MKTTIGLIALLCFGSVFADSAPIDAAKDKVARLTAELDEAKAELKELQAAAGIETDDDDDVAEDSLTKAIREGHLSVRQSAVEQSKLSKPASFQYTDPNGGEETYNVDIGLTWNLSQLTGNTLTFGGEKTSGIADYSIFAEYHRDNRTSAEKDSFQAGGLLSATIGDVSTDRFVNYFDLKAAYKNDRVNTADGFLGSFTWWPYVGRRGDSFLAPNIGGVFGPEWLPMVVQPGLGVQYETASDIDKSGRSGNVFRGKAIGEMAFYPFADRLSAGNSTQLGPLELTAGYELWDNFNTSGGFSARTDNHTLFTASLNYYFGSVDDELDKSPFAIGLDYVNGENPEEGFKDDDFWRLGLKVIF